MLYNKEWGKPRTDLFDLDRIIAWVEKQPADSTYIYSSCHNCLLGQYFKEMGYRKVIVTPVEVELDGVTHRLPCDLNWTVTMASDDGARTWKFGIALKNLKALRDRREITARYSDHVRVTA